MDFMIFTAPSIWGKEGTLEIDGLVFDPSEGWNANLIPKGTHAIRWSDPYWFWAKDGKTVNTLPNDHSPAVEEYWKSQGGPPVRHYTFKNGPLGDGNKSPYFGFPLAGEYSNSAPPPELADTLVVQVTLPDEVEYLTASNSPADPTPLPPDWGLIKDFTSEFDPCKVPEFCEPEPAPGGKGIICIRLGWYEFCPKKEETSKGLGRVRDLSAAVARHVLVARASTGTDAQVALRVVRERLECAQQFGNELARVKTELLDTIRRNAKTPHSMHFAVRMSLQVELGLRALSRCATRLGGSLEGGGLDALFRDARLAHRSFSTAMLQFQRLETWALPAEVDALESTPPTATTR